MRSRPGDRARRAAAMVLARAAALVPFVAYRQIAALERICQIFQGTHWVELPDVEARAILPLLPLANATVVDAGACHGRWTRSLLECGAGRVSRVYALEPIADLALRLDGLSLPRVSVFSVAVSDRTGILTLHVPHGRSGRDFAYASAHHSVNELAKFVDSTDEMVWATTLDEFATAHGIDRIDFLKMDIEGHEMAALRGAAGLLATGRIRALSFELGEFDVASRTFFRDFWELLHPLGFRFYRITYGGRLYPVEQYTTDLETFGKSNYVAALG